MKKYALFLWLAVAFCLVACNKEAFTDDSEESPVFVTDIQMPDETHTFQPGDTVTISAQGFEYGDDIMLDLYWAIDLPNLDEGFAKAQYADVLDVSAYRIRFLAPGRYPASRVEVYLLRQGRRMLLGEIHVADGQTPAQLQLYGIINSRSNANRPYGIDHINPATGEITEVVRNIGDLTQAIGTVGDWTLYALSDAGGKKTVFTYDFSIDHGQDTGMQALALCTAGAGSGAKAALMQDGETTLALYSLSTATRTSPESVPYYSIPEGMKPEALSTYPGIIVSQDHAVLLSADNGDGTWSPVLLGLPKGIGVMDTLQARALIPFCIAQAQTDASGGAPFRQRAGYAVVDEAGTRFCLWDFDSMSLQPPFATYPDEALSVATCFEGELDTQQLYVLFDTDGKGSFIEAYDMTSGEWGTRPVSWGLPYAEIVWTR